MVMFALNRIDAEEGATWCQVARDEYTDYANIDETGKCTLSASTGSDPIALAILAPRSALTAELCEPQIANSVQVIGNNNGGRSTTYKTERVLFRTVAFVTPERCPATFRTNRSFAA